MDRKEPREVAHVSPHSLFTAFAAWFEVLHPNRAFEKRLCDICTVQAQKYVHIPKEPERRRWSARRAARLQAWEDAVQTKQAWREGRVTHFPKFWFSDG